MAPHHGFFEQIYLDYSKATLPGFADGYGTPCGSDTSGGTNHPDWRFLFDAAAEERCWWNFALPRYFVSSKPIKVKVYWKAATAVTGDVVWGVKVLGRKEGEVHDAALGDEVEATDAVQDAAGELTVTEIELAPAKHALEAGDTVVLQLARKATDADDDLAEDAEVVMVAVEYATNPKENW